MRRPLMLVALCLVLTTGFLLHLGVFDRVPKGQIDAGTLTAGEPLTFTGRVYQRDSEKLYVQCVRIISSAGASLPAIPCKDNFICIPGQKEEIPLGSTVKMTGTFQSFSPATNPGEFDFAEYYRIMGIGGRVTDAVILARGDSYWEIREAMYQLRCLVKRRLELVLPEKEAAVMCALLSGDKEDLDPELKELYQRNGILHILSISSLHITMIGTAVYKLLRRCRMPRCPAATAGCGLLFFYVLMTGFSVSACRAMGMYALRMTAEMIGRTYDMPTALGVTAAFLVAENPYYLRHCGFLLSFTSMAGIGGVYPALRSMTAGHQRTGKEGERKGNLAQNVQKGLRDAFLSGISITLTTLPVQLWFYYQVPGYSVLLNLLVLPFMKILMAAGFLALIPGLGICGEADLLILRGYEKLCSLFDALPFHTWNPGKPRLWQVLVYYVLLAAGLYIGKRLWGRNMRQGHRVGAGRRGWGYQAGTGRSRRRYRAGAGVCLMVLFLNPAVFLWHPAPENEILFLDVGQGDGILVRTASGENYLFDCGSSSRSGAGKYVLLPCLRYYGIGTLDAVILSHPDGDHVNGAMELISMGQASGVRIRQLVLPGLSEERRKDMLEQLAKYMEPRGLSPEIPTGCLSAGDSFFCDRAEFLCLHPQRGWDGEEPNAYSVCIYGAFHDGRGEKTFDFLMTGDVEKHGEEALLEELRDREIQGVSLLKIAHHGSRNSTSEDLLEQVMPALSVISCGSSNRYGHPHRELLERLEKAHSATVITSETGAVRVSADEKGILRVETVRQAWRCPVP